MLIVNAVEVNNKLYLMADIPEERKEEVLAALEQYDKSFQEMEVMDKSQLEEVRTQLTNQSAKAIGYKRTVA